MLQAIERARSEVRTAECAVVSLTEVCDSLRGDEADLRERLHQLHRTAAAAEEEAAAAVAGRDAACQVRNCSSPAVHNSVRSLVLHESWRLSTRDAVSNCGTSCHHPV